MFKLFGKRGARPVLDDRRGPHHTEPGPEACNTAQKIDAIESEMRAEFSAASRLVTESGKAQSASTREDSQAGEATPTLQSAIEEAAILHASEQSDLALQLLLDATAALPVLPVSTLFQVPPQEQLAWRMAFDLCQLGNLQPQFEQLALVYASRFETSPPQWTNRITPKSRQETTQPVPSISCRGKLSANNTPLFEHLQKQAASHVAICIECSGVTEVEVEGCAHLLRILQQSAAQSRHVSLAGASGLLEKIRALIKPGRRDDNDAGWLLLIELLRLMNNEKEHEEVCLDYCVTYEVSPPAFVAPAGMPHTSCTQGGHFVLPRVITAPLDPLWEAISRHTANAKAIVLDANELARIDFTVAAPLVQGLLRLHATKPVELRNTNFLVSVLLQLVGGKDKLSILTRKL